MKNRLAVPVSTPNAAASLRHRLLWTLRWSAQTAAVAAIAVVALKLLFRRQDLDVQESVKLAARTFVYLFVLGLLAFFVGRTYHLRGELDAGVSKPGIQQAFLRALGWGVKWALGLTLFWVAFQAVDFLLNMSSDASWLQQTVAYVKMRGASLGSVVLFCCFTVVLTLFGLVQSSRDAQDRTFTWLGFCATFFGMAMLVLFLVQLLFQVQAWLMDMPARVTAQNQETLKAREDLKQTEKIVAEKRAEVEVEYQAALAEAATPEEKKEVTALYMGPGGVFEDAAKQYLVTLEEQREIASLPLRDDSTLGTVQHFLTSGPGDKPENAGILFAILGSGLLALITIVFAVPVGVGAALYLEEYRQKGWLGSLIQININNLAGVPSVVYGILGGTIFVGFFQHLEVGQSAVAELLRANPNASLSLWDQLLAWLPAISARNILGGGLTLGLLTLPIIIVSAQEAIRAVPPSIRQGAYALGATRWQVIWRNVLPMARPGILTGTILAISRAIGEAAPLILFGALIFVDQPPGLFSRFTILPMQIFDWSQRPTEGPIDYWKYNAAVAILVLLTMLLLLNAVAIWLRNRAQKGVRY